MDKLTTTNYVQLTGGIGGVLLSFVLVQVLYAEYNKPDLRYEEGDYYRSGEEAVTSVKLQNYGHSDVDDINLVAAFPEPFVRPPITSDENAAFSVVSGGTGERAVSGTMKRLVPDEVVYVYFSVKNPKGPIKEKGGFIQKLTYKGGTGKTGWPWAWVSPVTTVGFVFCVVMWVVYYINRMVTKATEVQEEAAKRIKMAQEAQDVSEEQHRQLLAMWDEGKTAFDDGKAKLTELMGEAKNQVEELMGEAHKRIKAKEEELAVREATLKVKLEQSLDTAIAPVVPEKLPESPADPASTADTKKPGRRKKESS